MQGWVLYVIWWSITELIPKFVVNLRMLLLFELDHLFLLEIIQTILHNAFICVTQIQTIFILTLR
jgi:hypothetical protein